MKRTQNNERQLEKALQQFFKTLREEVLTQFNEYWSDYQLLQGQITLMTKPITDAEEEYNSILERYIRREYKLGTDEAKRLVQLSTRRAEKSLLDDLRKVLQVKATRSNLFGTLAEAEQELLERTFIASKRTLARITTDINILITEGYTSGKGINVVAGVIEKRFNQLETWEARRIARTEIHNAHNNAVMRTYNTLGVEYTQWIAADDDRTRESHLEIDREIIPMGGTYSNGLSYPGDTSGPIEEWINCRCSNAPFVMPAGMMAPPFSPFKESDLVPIEVEPVQPTEPQPIESMEDVAYQLNNNENSYSNVEISQETFEQVIAHQSNRATAKIEWGNVVDLESGNLTHATDIKGKRNQVTIPRPNTNKGYGIIHNHPSGAAFSGADIVNTLDYRFQQACFATTEDGIWIARETEQATFSKSNFGITDNSKYEIKAKMDRKSREISNEIYNEKYKDRIANAKTRKEVNAIKKEYQTDKDYRQRYGDWLLEEYGVGKRRDNLIEIEFIPKERFKHVKF